MPGCEEDAVRKLLATVAFSILQITACATCAEETKPRAPTSQPADSPAPAAAAEAPDPAQPPLETSPPNVPELKPAFAQQTRAPGIQSKTAIAVQEIATGFEKPWALAFLPDGRMLVTEKPTGKLYIVTPAGQKSAPVAGLPRVDGRDQGGLLDVEIDPGYAQNGIIYWTYYEPREDGNGLAVARAKLVHGPKPKVAQLSVIFRMQPTLDSTKHAGGRLVFAPDGMLFVTLGDRSELEGRRQARDLDSHFGKIVRIRPDGTVPDDNPFVGQKGARPEIWTRGHRNVLSAALDAQNRLWVVEMGPRGGDELNLIERGNDYGWPTIGYGEEYSGASIHETAQSPGLEQPIYYWDPVISPSGLTIYSGELFPEWKGNLFIGGLSSEALVRLVLEGDRVVGEERLLMDRKARIREVIQGPDGALYLLTDDEDGSLLKVTPRDG
jgi:glucose/arabinose dehydrogenase